jgi:hypothetical protein
MRARLSGSPASRHPQPLVDAMGARRRASPTSQGRRCSTSYPSSTPECAPAGVRRRPRSREDPHRGVRQPQILHDRRLCPVRSSSPRPAAPSPHLPSVRPGGAPPRSYLVSGRRRPAPPLARGQMQGKPDRRPTTAGRREASDGRMAVHRRREDDGTPAAGGRRCWHM